MRGKCPYRITAGPSNAGLGDLRPLAATKLKTQISEVGRAVVRPSLRSSSPFPCQWGKGGESKTAGVGRNDCLSDAPFPFL